MHVLIKLFTFYLFVTSVSGGWFDRIKTYYDEVCDERWIINDIAKLRKSFADQVFGQHIATGVILKQIGAHLRSKSLQKPLVLSFHGATGNGKSHIAYLIADSLYLKGSDSKHYHHFMATTHFPHQSHVADYREQIRSWVKGNVSECSQSLFVFDEVDKMPAGILDGIRSFLDHNRHVDNIDYRNSIFIFLSNTGGQMIMEQVHQLCQNRAREKLTIQDFESLIEDGAFNEEGNGLHKAQIIEESIIDMYIPFLPMERSHVQLCAQREFARQRFWPNNMQQTLESIVNSLVYLPADSELNYSSTGCKRVAQKVGIYIANEHFRFDDEL